MPVRRKVNRRRVAATLDAWSMYLEAGTDYFDDLPAAGVTVDESGRPSVEDAVEAWQAYAADLLELWATTRRHHETEPWAVQQFGLPKARLRRCR